MNTKLQKARKKEGLTQVRIAKEIGITETNYQRIEYGKQVPRVNVAIKIAKTLNTTVEELFNEKTNLKE